MYFWERKSGIRDRDEKSAGCGIPVKKERECETRIPLPDPGFCLHSLVKMAKPVFRSITLVVFLVLFVGIDTQ